MATKYVKNNIFELSGTDAQKIPFEWWGLPECEQENNEAPYILVVRIESEVDLHKFADLISQPLLKEKTKRSTKSMWYPELEHGERGSNINYMWMEESEIKFGEK